MLNFKGPYDSCATYQAGDAITHEGMAYVCKRSVVIGRPPPDLDVWKRTTLGPVGDVGISGCQEGVFISTSDPRGKPGVVGHPGCPPSSKSPEFHNLVSHLQAQTNIPVPQPVDWLHIYLVYIPDDSANFDETNAVIAIAKNEADAVDCARNSCDGETFKEGYSIDLVDELVVKCLGVAAQGLGVGLVMSSVRRSCRR
jgi:hypothetical protein